MGTRVRILLENDSVKSSSESVPKASLVLLLMYKSHSCSELTEHKLSLVQRLFRDMAVTTPAPVTPPSFSWEEEAQIRQQLQLSNLAEHRNTLSYAATKGIRGSQQGGKSALVNW